MMVSRQEKMANVLYFNKNHVCLIIIAKMMQQTAEALSVSGRFHLLSSWQPHLVVWVKML